jgi:hypothetical protein
MLLIGTTQGGAVPCSGDAPERVEVVRTDSWRRPIELRGWSAARSPSQMKLTRDQAIQLRDLLEKALYS